MRPREYKCSYKSSLSSNTSDGGTPNLTTPNTVLLIQCRRRKSHLVFSILSDTLVESLLLIDIHFGQR